MLSGGIDREVEFRSNFHDLKEIRRRERERRVLRACRAVARRDSNDIVRARVQFRCAIRALAHAAGSAGVRDTHGRSWTRSVSPSIGIRSSGPGNAFYDGSVALCVYARRHRTRRGVGIRYTHTGPSWRSSRSRYYTRWRSVLQYIASPLSLSRP